MKKRQQVYMSTSNFLNKNQFFSSISEKKSRTVLCYTNSVRSNILTRSMRRWGKAGENLAENSSNGGKPVLSLQASSTTPSFSPAEKASIAKPTCMTTATSASPITSADANVSPSSSYITNFFKSVNSNTQFGSFKVPAIQNQHSSGIIPPVYKIEAITKLGWINGTNTSKDNHYACFSDIFKNGKRTNVCYVRIFTTSPFTVEGQKMFSTEEIAKDFNVEGYSLYQKLAAAIALYRRNITELSLRKQNELLTGKGGPTLKNGITSFEDNRKEDNAFLKKNGKFSEGISNTKILDNE